MTKTILCAVDINRPEDETSVVLQAKKMADLEGAQLDFITVVPDFGANVVSAYLNDHDVKTAQDGAAKKLNEMIANVIGEEANTSVRHVLAIGTVYEEVLKAAKISQADLIVIGAHRADFKDYLLGPNAARVVRHSDCSVYVVR